MVESTAQGRLEPLGFPKVGQSKLVAKPFLKRQKTLKHWQRVLGAEMEYGKC